jgi:ubiquinone/menaquinone biosynthesis C-methylase UbiE
VLGRQVELAGGSGPGAVRFSWSGPLRALLGLRTAVAVYLLVSVPGRRPSTLLGDTTLFDQVETVRRLHRPGSFSSFRLSVPGRDSAALRRLRQELTARTGLGHDPDEGELYLRIRRSAGGDGWDLLTRLTPRPLSARGWRVVNFPGALNATIAAAMVELSRPRPDDRVLNLMCGSGTILVERLARAPAALAAGCDLDPAALAASRRNLEAAGLARSAALARMDATALGVGGASFEVLLADLPYGHRMGSHQGNAALYPAVLAEAARVTRPGGALLAVTHELRLFQRCLRAETRRWQLERAVQVYQKGHHPVVHLLRRTAAASAPRRRRGVAADAGGGGEQVEHGVGHLLVRAGGCSRAGVDAVDPDAPARKGGGERAREGDHSALGDGVGGLVGRVPEGVDGAEVDDGAAAAAAHRRDGGLAREHGPGQVDRQHAVPAGDVGGEQIAPVGGRGRVDQQVEPAERRLGGGHRPAGGHRMGDVAAQVAGAGRGGVRRLDLVDHDDAHALGEQAGHDRAAEAARASGHDRDLPVQRLVALIVRMKDFIMNKHLGNDSCFGGPCPPGAR